MGKYNISAEEVARVISLYSKITNPEKRIYAQGYLNGLSATTPVVSLGHEDRIAQIETNNSENHQ